MIVFIAVAVIVVVALVGISGLGAQTPTSATDDGLEHGSPPTRVLNVR